MAGNTPKNRESIGMGVASRRSNRRSMFAYDHVNRWPVIEYGPGA